MSQILLNLVILNYCLRQQNYGIIEIFFFFFKEELHNPLIQSPHFIYEKKEFWA